MRSLSFSRELKKLLDRNSQDPVCLRDLLDQLGVRAHALVIILLSLPFIFPLPSMGLSTIFGGVIILLAGSLMFGRKPWIPERWGALKISRETLEKFVGRAEWLSKKMERFVRPRGLAFSMSQFWKPVHALMIVIAALILALPLPPGGNVLPAAACLILGVGMVEEDGIILALGYLLTAINVILLLMLFLYGFDWLKEFL
jgi:hypothetical protein